MAFAILACHSALAADYDFKVDGIYYNIISEEDRTVEVTNERGGENPKYYGDYSASELVIPSKVINQSKTYTVVSIGEWAFGICSSLTSVELPSSVTTIGERAFSGCSSLTSIELPSSLTSIGRYAFIECSSLTSIELPSSLTSIENYTFSNCSSLTSVKLPSSLTSIGWYAFRGCSSLTSVELPSSLTAIGEEAFSRCSSLTSIELPSSLTAIENYTFRSCSSLTSVKLPSSLTAIGEEAFRSCSSLTSVELPSSLTAIEEEAFSYCSSLTSIELPSSLTTIYVSTFKGCSNLSAINVDKNNQSYVSEDGVLYTKDMTELVYFPEGKTTVNFRVPKSVTTIGESAFCYCSSLTSIELPSSLTSIEWYAFSGCSSLTSVYCKATIPPACDGNVFGDNTLKETLYVPIGTKADYEAVDPWRNFWTIEESDFTVGVEDIERGEEIVVVTDGNSIVVTGDNAGRIEVYSVNGQSVYSGNETTIGGLAKGVYVVKVGNNTYKVLL